MVLIPNLQQNPILITILFLPGLINALYNHRLLNQAPTIYLCHNSKWYVRWQYSAHPWASLSRARRTAFKFVPDEFERAPASYLPESASEDPLCRRLSATHIIQGI